MAETHEWLFYEMMWRTQSRGGPLPLPWWVQQYFRYWVDFYDTGLFPSKEAAFASNAYYRYWNMVGVKDAHQESLIGQAGEIEPVYEQYVAKFCLFDPSSKRLFFPQSPHAQLTQETEDGYLPIVVTKFDSELGIVIEQKVFATVVGTQQKSLALARFKCKLSTANAVKAWLCITVSPAGPTGFSRHDNAGRYMPGRRLTLLHYIPSEARTETNIRWGPTFDTPPASFGIYGNQDSIQNPDFYLDNSPYQDLLTHGSLNGQTQATDQLAGLCSGMFAWVIDLTPANPEFALDVRLPLDDFKGPNDLNELRSETADQLENKNHSFWVDKLDQSGFQASLPPQVEHLFKLYRTCRANLLILSDHGEIHPGPTIYDSFWIRDSSVEGIACALNGDLNLAERQFGTHYPTFFNHGNEFIGPVSVRGFFGSEHEKNDREWDSNGQALWAFGRFDRILGKERAFGAAMFLPYIIEGAMWLRDNRSEYGLLHSGWSAEHIGDKDKPHYWDDFWAIAGLWEAGKLAERIKARQSDIDTIWSTYNSLKNATADSIRWVLTQQRQRGFWETFIPTGPADVGRLDSTIIGAISYFHPCRLYMGSKLGDDIDLAARLTLDTIWSHFIDGGFRHDSAWNCYGPYLTLQLAHAFLLIGDVEKMDKCLAWAVGNAAYARVDRQDRPATYWQVVLGAWNEQHCYPISKDYNELPKRSWYMGDIPHGWACAEFNLLLRDILFFEADEDNDPHIYLAAGLLPHWLADEQTVQVANAPTIFGGVFGYKLTHHQGSKNVEIEITQPPPSNVRFVYLCRFGSQVVSAKANDRDVQVSGTHVFLPSGTLKVSIHYN